jgi:hypothetical protein
MSPLIVGWEFPATNFIIDPKPEALFLSVKSAKSALKKHLLFQEDWNLTARGRWARIPDVRSKKHRSWWQGESFHFAGVAAVLGLR